MAHLSPLAPRRDVATFAVPQGGAVVLQNIASGRSPWHGWERGALPGTPESSVAYSARRTVIETCRQCGLTTPENTLTDLGRKALAIIGAANG